MFDQSTLVDSLERNGELEFPDWISYEMPTVTEFIKSMSIPLSL